MWISPWLKRHCKEVSEKLFWHKFPRIFVELPQIKEFVAIRFLIRSNLCKERFFQGSYKGTILVNTLWILLILSLLAFALAWRMSLELKLSHYFVSQLKDFYAAKAAISYAMEIMRRDNKSYDAFDERWANNPQIFKEKNIKEEEDTKFTISYVYGYDPENKPIVYYGLIDEERRLNLNLEIAALSAILGELKDAFLAQNETVLSEEIIHSILDWRDVDELARPENSVPESEFYGYSCRNGEFKILEELLLLKGIDGDSAKFARLKEYFTVYGSRKININTAGREILTAFASLMRRSIQGMPGFDVPVLVNEILERRQNEPFKNLNELSSIPSIGELLNALPADSRDSIRGAILNIMEIWLDVRSSCFQANVEAETRGSIKKGLDAVFNRNDNQILYWHED